MYTVLRTEEFDKWLSRLRDERAKARIAHRIRSAEHGNLGDVRSVGDRIHEMRVHYGPGYRVYFTTKGEQHILLLIGGDKSSQSRDIRKAREIAKSIEDL